MPFVKMPGVTGKVYVPELLPGQTRKHTCPDCFACQQCSDDRCTVCLGQGADCTRGDHCRRRTALSESGKSKAQIP